MATNQGNPFHLKPKKGHSTSLPVDALSIWMSLLMAVINPIKDYRDPGIYFVALLREVAALQGEGTGDVYYNGAQYTPPEGRVRVNVSLPVPEKFRLNKQYHFDVLKEALNQLANNGFRFPFRCGVWDIRWSQPPISPNAVVADTRA